MPSKRVVAITGASSGIGRATALRLACDRASLAICARRGDRFHSDFFEVMSQETGAPVTRACGPRRDVERTEERALSAHPEPVEG
jgi:NAD(P)-dependent dehydrogenase (short-subunit alcohol dehydrogenase family)